MVDRSRNCFKRGGEVVEKRPSFRVDGLRSIVNFIVTVDSDLYVYMC